MASALVLTLVKYGLLVLLWLFVLSAFRVVRADLYGARSGRPAAGGPALPGAGGPGRRDRGRDGEPDPGRPGGRSAARRLVVTEGALAGTTLTLGDAPITLGRADDSGLVLTDDYASNHHARLYPGEGAWLLEDLGSTNGTFLGPAQVTRPTPVPLGQPIRIGRTVLELQR